MSSDAEPVQSTEVPATPASTPAPPPGKPDREVLLERLKKAREAKQAKKEAAAQAASTDAPTAAEPIKTQRAAAKATVVTNDDSSDDEEPLLITGPGQRKAPNKYKQRYHDVLDKHHQLLDLVSHTLNRALQPPAEAPKAKETAPKLAVGSGNVNPPTTATTSAASNGHINSLAKAQIQAKVQQELVNSTIKKLFG